MMKSRTIAVSIHCSPGKVYEFASRPENLPLWLTFITGARKSGDDWFLETPEGLMGIRFLPANSFGVLDHFAILPDGQTVLNPMRVVANGEGSELLFTLFQYPGMSDEQFAKDARTVEVDLNKLKCVLESVGN